MYGLVWRASYPRATSSPCKQSWGSQASSILGLQFKLHSVPLVHDSGLGQTDAMVENMGIRVTLDKNIECGMWPLVLQQHAEIRRSCKHPTQQTTPQPEYSPALPMGWVPGVKPRTIGPGHHPMGGVLTVSWVRTPQCQTPPPGSPRPPSTGRQGSGNSQRPLERMADTASPSCPPGRPPPPPPPAHRALYTAVARASPTLSTPLPPAAARVRPLCPGTPCHPPPVPQCPAPCLRSGSQRRGGPHTGPSATRRDRNRYVGCVSG